MICQDFDQVFYPILNAVRISQDFDQLSAINESCKQDIYQIQEKVKKRLKRIENDWNMDQTYIYLMIVFHVEVCLIMIWILQQNTI